VTAARALEITSSQEARQERVRLTRAADGCRAIRQALAHDRRPLPDEWVPLADAGRRAVAPLIDIERTLDEIALAAPHAEPEPAKKRSLFLPDAFENPEYVRFAFKGTLAALICYLLFVGFDYPGIYTSVITCFVVALSTVGASNQKGVLRFGGAAVGGALALFALMYLFPNVETIAGFWLIFGAATAVAAWVNFGSPRVSYGGYQIGLAFYKAVLQGFGMAVSATVIRDRLVGIALGLIVYTLVENSLWPVRAADALRTRLSAALRQLANLARSGPGHSSIADSRLRIAHDLEEVQGLIESTKFEPGMTEVDAMQRTTGEAQTTFVLLLSLARQRGATTPSGAAAAMDHALAGSLDALADRVGGKTGSPAPSLADALRALERSARDPASTESEPLPLYRALVAVLVPALAA
jgi:multidrug resistance protein MdtO